MVLFSIGFWYAFSASEYSTANHQREDRLPVGQAFIHALNPADLIGGMLRIPGYTIDLHRQGEWAAWRKALRAHGPMASLRKVRNWRPKKQNQPDSAADSELENSDDFTSGVQRFAKQPTNPPAYTGPRDEPYDVSPFANNSDRGLPGAAPEDEGWPLSTLRPDEQGGRGFDQSSGRTSRARSPSGTFLMADPNGRGERERQGEWNGRGYDRSPDRRFDGAPMQGRDMV